MFNALANPLTVKQQRLDYTATFSIARSERELTEAFNLVFESYLRAGLSVDNPSGLRLTPYHLLPTTEVLVAKINNETVSTISIIGDGDLGLPMQSMYAKEVVALRRQGLRVAEVGCLADRRDCQMRFIEVLAGLGRLLAQFASANHFDGLVAAVHPKHARLYRRVLGFKQIGDYTECPYANGNPAVALFLRFDDYVGTNIHDQFFSDPFPQQQLLPYDWNSSMRKYFRRVLGADAKIAEVIPVKGYYDWPEAPASPLVP